MAIMPPMGEALDDAEIEASATGVGEAPLWEAGTQVGGEIAPEVIAELDRAWDKPKPVKGVLLAVALALAVQAFLIEIPDRAASGPWMGFALLPQGTLPELLPPLWQALTHTLSAYASISLVKALFVVSMGGAALAASAVAALCAHLIGRDTAAAPWLAGLLGGAAGACFGLSFIAALARYGAGPEALAAAFALWAVFYLLRAYDRRGLTLELMIGAVCLGGAAVEQPYYLALFVGATFFLFLFQRDDGYQRERVFSFVFVFAFTLTAPALALLRTGVSIGAFAEHLLHLPIPDASWRPGDFVSRWGNPVALTTIVPLIALGTLACILRGKARNELIFLLAMAVLLGPAMYLLASPPAGNLVPIDIDSPRLAAFGLLCAAALAGAARLGQSPKWPVVRVCFCLFLASFCLLLSVWEGGERLADADALGTKRLPDTLRELVDDMPQGALVAVGDLDAAGALWAMQSAGGYRNDLRIVPVSWLSRRPGRVAAQSLVGPTDALEDDFPSGAAIERWKRDLPMYVDSLGDGPIATLEARLEPFALWDLVTSERKPVYFVAVDAPWVLSRATPQGHRLVYPAESTAARLPETVLGALNQGDSLLGQVTTAINRANAHAQAARVLESADPALQEAVMRLEALLAVGKGELTEELTRDTDLLWRNDRVFALKDFYTRLAALPGADPEIFYQLAAADAVLGQWQETEQALAQWLAAGQPDDNGLPGAGLKRLLADSRFDLFANRVGTLRLTMPSTGEDKKEE